jgi:hypothetical protein
MLRHGWDKWALPSLFRLGVTGHMCKVNMTSESEE